MLKRIFARWNEQYIYHYIYSSDNKKNRLLRGTLPEQLPAPWVAYSYMTRVQALRGAGEMVRAALGRKKTWRVSLNA